MLDFNQFEKIIIHIKNKIDSDEKLTELLYGGNCVISYGEDLLHDVVKLLTHIMNDDGEWIEYWLWELNFGTQNDRLKVFIDDKEIPLTTIQDLYNIITKD